MENKRIIFLLFSIVLLAAGLIYLFNSQQRLSHRLDQLTYEPDQVVVEKESSSPINTCGSDCQKKIEEEVAKVVATISQTPTLQVPQSQTAAKKNIDYITLNGPVTTTSTQWVEIPGVEVYIDLIGDYGKGATASWEATLKVAHGNGQAYARIFDVTHGTAVDGSEFSTTNNPNYSLVSSGNISLWAGRNLYRLQLKSLNSFEVTFLSGRIKITY